MLFVVEEKRKMYFGRAYTMTSEERPERCQRRLFGTSAGFVGASRGRAFVALKALIRGINVTG
jgi:hypothetical protein